MSDTNDQIRQAGITILSRWLVEPCPGSGSSVIKRQLEFEACSDIQVADDRDSAFMQVQYSFYDCKAKARRIRPCFFALLGAIKPVEYAGDFTVRDA